MLKINYQCYQCAHVWEEYFESACDSTCPECEADDNTALDWVTVTDLQPKGDTRETCLNCENFVKFEQGEPAPFCVSCEEEGYRFALNGVDIIKGFEVFWELGHVISEEEGTTSTASFDNLDEALRALKESDEPSAFIDLWINGEHIGQEINKDDLKQLKGE